MYADDEASCGSEKSCTYILMYVLPECKYLSCFNALLNCQFYFKHKNDLLFCSLQKCKQLCMPFLIQCQISNNTVHAFIAMYITTA